MFVGLSHTSDSVTLSFGIYLRQLSHGLVSDSMPSVLDRETVSHIEIDMMVKLLQKMAIVCS
jgi:hypothetical protein